jgi:hypothetical protein
LLWGLNAIAVSLALYAHEFASSFILIYNSLLGEEEKKKKAGWPKIARHITQKKN